MQKKSINRYRSFCRSLADLKDARGEDPANKFVLSGTVQMFCLSFDLSWKVMKDVIIQYHGLTDFAAGSPRETLRTAGRVGLIEGDMWMEMLRARNNLTHDYDGELAKKYFHMIISAYSDKMEQFKERASGYYAD